jgi:hypothetical protein
LVIKTLDPYSEPDPDSLEMLKLTRYEELVKVPGGAL